MRRRAPIGALLVLLSAWIAAGIRRVDPESGLAVIDAPLGLLAPRRVGPGWHLAPPGLLRLSIYPAEPRTYAFEVGESGSRLASREGIEVVAGGLLRYRVDAERLLDLHRGLGPRFESAGIARWIDQDLRAAVAASGYSDISGARSERLRESVGQSLAEHFRTAGLVLLSCDVREVRIRDRGAAGGDRHAAAIVRTLFIGIDGADWNILDPLIAAGKLPNLGRIARDGVRGRLRSITPMLSPVVWTSIATGVLPGRHGIVDFVAASGPDGARVPVTSTLRRTPAIWNILSDHGVRVGITAWWATYPAETVNGFIVSDRVAYQLFGGSPVRLQEREGKVFPADLDAAVAEMIIRPETIGVAEVGRYIRLSADPEALPADENKLIDDFKTLLAAGDTYARVSLALSARLRPDFTAFYLEGTDTVAHLFMRYAPPPLPGVTPAQAARFGRAVDAYYRHADELVGRLIEAAGPGTAIIVVSDHGFRTGDNRPLTDSRIGYGQAADWHRKHGIVAFLGAPFRRGATLEEASVLDITPTILALYGLPVAEDMDGRPILDAFDPEWLAAHPVTYVPTYEKPNPAAVAAAPSEPGAAGSAVPSDPVGDRELKEKLESLGYLSQNTANAHNNRGMLLLTQGKLDAALAEFEQAIRSSESLDIARINIARTLLKKKDYDGAVRELETLLQIRPRSKEAENLLGNIAMERGRMDEAERRFLKALGYEPNFTDARNSLGILYDRLGRETDALREFDRVVAIDPEYAEALNNIGVIHKKRGRVDQAIAVFRRAIAADPEFTGSYSNLALVLEQKGDLKGAEQQYKKALGREPRDAAVRTNYGGLLYTLGRFDEARRELEEAVKIDPAYASAYNNLGAVYGKLGRSGDEIAAYRRAVAIDTDYADVHHNLGLALLKQGHVEEGESELRRALGIDKKYSSAYINLARSLSVRGNLKESLDVLSSGSRELPADASIHAVLGEVYDQMGEKEKAVEAFRRSLKLNPNQPDLERRLPETQP